MATAWCPRCSATIQPGDAFCPGCGRRLESGAPFVVHLIKERRYEVDGESLRISKGREALAAMPWREVGEVGARMVGPGVGAMRFGPSPLPRGSLLVYAAFYASSRGKGKAITFDQREVVPTEAQRREVEALYPARTGMDPPYNYLMILLTLRRTAEVGNGRGEFRVSDLLGTPTNP